MSQLRDEAEALARALETGLCGVAEAVSWSDCQILREESPPANICEVAISHDRYPQDVAALLRKCPGVPVNSRVQHLFALLAREKLRQNPDCAYGVAWALYQMAFLDEIEDSELRSIAWWAWDALDLADAGHILESREQIIEQMAAALDDATRSDVAGWATEFADRTNANLSYPGNPSSPQIENPER
ncbi:MAG: hypothetical protein JNM56_21090 [Planctomycetia bacterium]|nr:hypothetical protein [Planctomycetia bacterium]